MVERVVVEQVALLRAAARVTDHAGRSAGESDRAMTGILESAQHHEADQVADVKAVGGRVAPVVDANGSVRHLCPKQLPIGRVVDEAASLEVGDQIHSVTMMPRRARKPHDDSGVAGYELLAVRWT